MLYDPAQQRLVLKPLIVVCYGYPFDRHIQAPAFALSRWDVRSHGTVQNSESAFSAGIRTDYNDAL